MCSLVDDNSSKNVAFRESRASIYACERYRDIS